LFLKKKYENFFKWPEPELFTSQDCCSGNEAACEAVFVYREQAAKKSMRQDWLARRGKIADHLFFLTVDFICLKE